MLAAIIQARVTTSRLPAKVLLDLVGKPILTRVIERLRLARQVDKIVVATSTAERDDPIARLAESAGATCFRGSEIDLLNRYYRAAISVGAGTVVRITSDCPLIDPALVDEAITLHKNHIPQPDYLVTQGYPDGFAVEVVSFTALERAWRDDHDATSREHVTAYIARHPEVFTIVRAECPEPQDHVRVTLDTIEDYQLIYKIVREFGDAPFGWRDVVDLLKSRREWLRLNAHVARPTPFRQPSH